MVRQKEGKKEEKDRDGTEKSHSKDGKDHYFLGEEGAY